MKYLFLILFIEKEYGMKKEGSYLGWERKRGMLNQLNEYLLKNLADPFLYNSIEKIPQIKYIITLDADTDLVLNTAQELVEQCHIY